MQRKAEVHNFDGRANVALVDARIINSSGHYIWFTEIRTGENRGILFSLRFANHYVLFHLLTLLLRILPRLPVFNFWRMHISSFNYKSRDFLVPFCLLSWHEGATLCSVFVCCDSVQQQLISPAQQVAIDPQRLSSQNSCRSLSPFLQNVDEGWVCTYRTIICLTFHFLACWVIFEYGIVNRITIL